MTEACLTFTSEVLVINGGREGKERLAVTHALSDGILHSRLHLVKDHDGVHGGSTLRDLLGWFGQWLCLGLENNFMYYCGQ